VSRRLPGVSRKKSFIVTSHEPSIDPHNSEKGEDLVVEDSRGREVTRVSEGVVLESIPVKSPIHNPGRGALESDRTALTAPTASRLARGRIHLCTRARRSERGNERAKDTKGNYSPRVNARERKGATSEARARG